MARTIIILLVLCTAVLYLPLWMQLILFLLGVLFVKYRLCVLIPALFADVLYAPDGHFGLMHFKMTLFVLVVLGIYWIIITQTRIKVLYGSRI